MNAKVSKRTRLIATVGILTVLGVILVMLVHFPIIPAAPFLEVDFGDTPAMIAGYALGPWVGLITVSLTAIVQALTVSASSGWIGALMHILASGTYILTSSLLYRRFHTRKGAIVSLLIGSAAGALMMIPMNLIFTPIFMGVDRAVVMGMILPAILPFNIIKFLFNSLLVFLLYTPLKGIIARSW